MAKELTPDDKTSCGGFRNKHLLSHYHDITERVFTDGRCVTHARIYIIEANFNSLLSLKLLFSCRGSQEQLNELFLNAVRVSDLCLKLTSCETILHEKG